MSNKPGSSLAGFSIIGATVTGIIAVLTGFLALVNETNYIGAGLLFLAAAFAFGLTANAVFRD